MALEGRMYMDTIVLTAENKQQQKECANLAGACIREGGVVAFPTETVYGLGADALNASASEKIYEAKERPRDNPLIILIAELSSLEKLVSYIPPKAKVLAEKFWPGPLTMVLEKSSAVPSVTTGGLQKVAVRMPNHPLTLEIIRQAGGYVTGPSANTSGRPSPTLAKHVKEDMQGKIQMIVDGGELPMGIESTIIDMTMEPPVILRPGCITQKMLMECIGSVVTKETKASNVTEEAYSSTKYKHYAPKAELKIVEGEPEAVYDTIRRFAINQLEKGKKVGIIATDESQDRYSKGIVKSIGSRKDDSTIARNLYGILREFDELQVDCIFSESFSEGKMGNAIMNRLVKAAGYQVIKAEKEQKEYQEEQI